MSELFYEDCLYGKPIVDLSLCNATQNLFNCVERIFHTHYGIQVGRDTIHRHAELVVECIHDCHGVTVAGEPLSVDFLSVLVGNRTVDREEYADELNVENIADLVGIPARPTLPRKALRGESTRWKVTCEVKLLHTVSPTMIDRILFI